MEFSQRSVSGILVVRVELKLLEVHEAISVISDYFSIQTLGFGNNIFYYVKCKFPVKQVTWHQDTQYYILRWKFSAIEW